MDTAEARAKRNEELRNRMQKMKREMNGAIGSVMNKMLSMMGQYPFDAYKIFLF